MTGIFIAGSGLLMSLAGIVMLAGQEDGEVLLAASLIFAVLSVTTAIKERE